LISLQHLQFQLPANVTNYKYRARYSLVPSIVDWLKRYTPNITRLTIESNDSVPVDHPSGPPVPPNEQWLSMDNAFKPSASGLEALQTVQLTIFCTLDSLSVLDEQVRVTTPFLSVLRTTVTRFDYSYGGTD
jgi:hypothetical protein